MSDASARELDIEEPAALVAYLRDSGRIGRDERVEVRNLAGGVSNRTVLVTRPSGEAWVLKQALAKLRVKVDWFSDPARIHREAMGMRWLWKVLGGSVTEPLFEDLQHHLFAMWAVPDPHVNFKTALLGGHIELGFLREFGDLLGEIHRSGWAERATVAAEFDDRSFFESLRLEPYYQYTSQQVPESAAFYEALIRHTRETRLTIVHGDYSPKNVLIWQGKLILLDHEVIHFGDPAFDAGFALAHLLSKAHHLPDSRRAMLEGVQIFWDAYRDSLGGVPWRKNLEGPVVHHALGCLLARVAGRSVLEYLSPQERDRQRFAVVNLMERPPRSVWDLMRNFTARLEKHGDD